MTIHVNIGKAKAQLSSLIAASLRGEEVVIDHDGVPQVRLVPLPEVADEERATRRTRLEELLARMDAIPDLPDAFDPLEWDENGLPI